MRTVTFMAEPFDFDSEYSTAYWGKLAPDVGIPFVRLETLIRMKEEAARPADLEDVRTLRRILEDKSHE